MQRRGFLRTIQGFLGTGLAAKGLPVVPTDNLILYEPLEGEPMRLYDGGCRSESTDMRLSWSEWAAVEGWLNHR